MYEVYDTQPIVYQAQTLGEAISRALGVANKNGRGVEVRHDGALVAVVYPQTQQKG